MRAFATKHRSVVAFAPRRLALVFRSSPLRDCARQHDLYLTFTTCRRPTFNRPDYVIFCNGDTYYAEEMFDSARYYLESGIGMVGMR